jgi:hypothetical protein
VVGTSGKAAMRLPALMASAASLPSLISESTLENGCTLKSTRPAMISVTASMPRKATCCASKPALTRRRSAPKCEADPIPAVE